MATADELGSAGITPERLETVATVTLSTEGNTPEVSQIRLDITAKLPSGDKDAFEKAANSAKENCPISRLMNADISLETHMES